MTSDLESKIYFWTEFKVSYAECINKMFMFISETCQQIFKKSQEKIFGKHKNSV